MELNHLKYFHEVAKQGSFTRASKTLRISQPSISKMVKLLEEAENIRLFDRTKKGVALTETGKLFYKKSRAIFDEVENLKSLIEMQRAECSGPLAIGASDNLCEYVLPRMLAAFGEMYPKVNVLLLNASSTHIKEEILDGKTELGIFYSRVKESVFSVDKLAHVEFVVACSSKNKVMKNGDYRDLKNIRFIGPRLMDYPNTCPMLLMLQEMGMDPTPSFETNSQQTQKKMVLLDHGYTIFPKHMIQSELRSGKLKIIKTPKKVGSDVFGVYRKNRTLTKPTALFLKYLREYLPRLTLKYSP